MVHSRGKKVAQSIFCGITMEFTGFYFVKDGAEGSEYLIS